MKTVNAIRAWWRGVWSKKLGLQQDTFPYVLEALQDRLLIVEKRCEALTPSVWMYRRD